MFLARLALFEVVNYTRNQQNTSFKSRQALEAPPAKWPKGEGVQHFYSLMISTKRGIMADSAALWDKNHDDSISGNTNPWQEFRP